mgnify:CR=1 FL=1
MRKIEQKMNAAIKAGKNWGLGNTSVITDSDNISRVYLHGNHIATVNGDEVTVYDGGWQSVTTKSRLNAIIEEFCAAGDRVFQSDWVWYVQRYVGFPGGPEYVNDEFVNGYTFC